jgi:hypothetical protein
MPDDFANRKEAFDVVMLKNGKHEATATIEDYRRVPVMASDPLQAQMSDEVAAQEGYYPLRVSRPGELTGPEMQARARAFEASDSNPRQW